MDRLAALRAWGLDEDASDEEVLAAYRVRSRPFKKRLLQAVSAKEKNAFRDALRALVIQRDAALGRPARTNWLGDALGVSSAELVDHLLGINSDQPDLERARALLAVEPDTPADGIDAAFSLRMRVLRRRFAKCDEEREMLRTRDAATILTRVRRVLRALATEGKKPFDSQSTLTFDGGQRAAIWLTGQERKDLPEEAKAAPELEDSAVLFTETDTDDEDLLEGMDADR